MEINDSDADVELAIKKFKHRLAHNATRHLNELPSRIGLIFQVNKIIISPERIDSQDIIQQLEPILTNPQLSKFLPGPLLYHLNEDNQSAEVFSISDLMLHPSLNLRKATLFYLNTILAKADFNVTPKTVAILHECSEAVISNEEDIWYQAAIKVSDAIDQDWLFNLAGLKQSIQTRFDEGFSTYFRKVMRPEFVEIDTIDIFFWEPSNQRKQIEKKIADIAKEHNDLGVALSEYLDVLGHIPLTFDLSMARLIQEWVIMHAAPSNMWNYLCTWVNQQLSPIARFHFCLAILNEPSFADIRNISQLWKEIAYIVDIDNSIDDESVWSLAWQTRTKITKHFCQYLECLKPWNDGEHIATFALWMAEKVCMALGNDNQTLQYFLEHVILPETELSSLQWVFARPCIAPSLLRYKIIYAHSLWSLSLLSSMGKNAKTLAASSMNTQDYSRITQAISLTLLTDSTLPIPKDQDAIYAFDTGVFPSAFAWIEIVSNDDLKNLLKAWGIGSQLMQEPQEIVKVIKNFNDYNEQVQQLVTMALRTMVFNDRIDVELIWTLLEDQNWRRNFLQKGTPIAIEALFISMTEIQVRNGDKWASVAPHFFAIACEESIDDVARKDLLFACTLLSCLNSNTWGAIQRLLKGKKRNEFAQDVKYWRESIDGVRLELLPWVSARVRALSANLHIE